LNERKTELLAACKQGQSLTGRLKPGGEDLRRKRRGYQRVMREGNGDDGEDRPG